MKLLIDGNVYEAKRPQIRPGEWFSIRIIGEAFPELPVEGELRVASDSGEELCVVQTSDYIRQTLVGNVLTMTNEPEPEPVPEPEPKEPEPGADELINILLGVAE